MVIYIYWIHTGLCLLSTGLVYHVLLPAWSCPCMFTVFIEEREGDIAMDTGGEVVNQLLWRSLLLKSSSSPGRSKSIGHWLFVARQDVEPTGCAVAALLNLGVQSGSAMLPLLFPYHNTSAKVFLRNGWSGLIHCRGCVRTVHLGYLRCVGHTQLLFNCLTYVQNINGYIYVYINTYMYILYICIYRCWSNY